MTESDFLALADASLNTIEAAFDRAAASHHLHLSCRRSGRQLEIDAPSARGAAILHMELRVDVGSQQIHVSASAHEWQFRRVRDSWLEVTDGSELLATLLTLAGRHAGVALTAAA